MKHVKIPNGSEVPALGLGTWKMGERPRKRKQEIAAIQCAIDLGMTVIDTAEMYGEGAAEELVGEAIQGRRAGVFLVTKVYPHNATAPGTIAACERSLRRLRVDSIDLYLLHWRGSVPLAETLEAFEKLSKRGDIISYGVSNFDTPDLEEVWALPFGSGIACNQILYNLKRRAVEYDLLPWCREHHVPAIAYSPVEQGRLLKDPKLREIADRHAVTPSQLAIAWLLAQPDIIAVPKSAFVKHVEENRAAADINLSEDDLARIDAIFPRPKGRKPLEML